jgi:hypothetical protein
MTRTFGLLSCIWTLSAAASEFEAIGLDQLRAMAPSLNGSGVVVAQPESEAPGWQVNPAVVNQPQTIFTWTSETGSASVFPNTVGAESWHANLVAQPFYGLTNGIAPGVAHVHSYEAGYFFNSLVGPQIAIPARLVNQSFIFGLEMADIDQDYDNYVARYNTIFASGAGNGGPVSTPATAYNVIAVAAYGGSSSIGPTLGGRSKPDITAPSTFTSYSTPQVAGAAALLLQAAAQGDAGAGAVSTATNAITIKALLLNGANKPPGWTNGSSTPLDARHGAGILHVGNSYRQLRGGKHSPVLIENVTVGDPHPPAITSSNLPTRRGWNVQLLSSTVVRHSVAHYFVDLTAAGGRAAKVTLVWNRGLGQMNINNLDLFLYDATSGALVASSESLVDNVEHICATNLPAARYNVQVLKHGGAGRVTASETYALAFEFGTPTPPAIAAQQVLANDLHVLVSGEPAQLYAVDVTSDLITWTPAVTNKTSALGAFEFIDPLVTPRRFLRAREVW